MYKEGLIAKAILARHMQRHEDLLNIMRRVLAVPAYLHPIEGTLLYAAYRNTCEAQKQSLIKLLDFYRTNMDNLTPREAELTRTYFINIRNTLIETCTEITEVLEFYLIPASMINMDNETTTLYLAMKGSHHEYAAKFAHKLDIKEVLISKAETAYEQGYHIAQNYLPAVNPKRLDIVLKYSAFIYNMRQDLPGACIMAKKELQKVDMEHQAGAEISDISASIINDIRANISNSRETMMRMIFPEDEDDSSSSSDNSSSNVSSGSSDS